MLQQKKNTPQNLAESQRYTMDTDRQTEIDRHWQTFTLKPTQRHTDRIIHGNANV